VADIDVAAVGAGGDGDPSFRVEVRVGPTTTAHDVAVPPDLVERIGWEGGNEELVRTSFEFLLAREPAGSILRRFSLDVIGDYFPEYVAEMRRRARAV
jgi:hypothetical protein